ncbi:MAG TPA: LysM peptidoglycan-binding domain-containing protein [Thermodesulfobacteriota bacterium]|nr:LysM peptidoglycan-binding domain-containing protein [Thermodesulfobacteriota bacterium]
MKTILIADNDSKVRNLVRLMFTESMGYRVVDTSSGRDAVLKAHTLKPDIVLANVFLSDKSGYEVSREIKNSPRIKSTPVVLLADSYETFDESMAAEVRSDDFILKPFRTGEIADKLEPFFARSKGKERFRISRLVSTGKLKSLMPVPRLTIERRVIFRSGVVALLIIFMLVLSVMYRTPDIKLSRSELSSWLNNLGNIDLLGDMPKSILSDNILKREIISLIKEENAETSDPITEAPAILPSPSPSKNMESSFEPETEKEVVKVYVWEEKESVEKPERLEPKEKIPMPEEGPEEVVAGNRYVVKKGDSLWTISNSFGISVDDIRVANDLGSNRLDVGNVLIIPTGNGETRLEDKEIPVPEEMPEEALEGNQYVVKKGDSLWTISNSFGISVDDIRVANNLGSDNLDVGDVLIIPMGKGEKRLKDEDKGQTRAESAETKVKLREEVTKNGTAKIPAPQPDEDRDETRTESTEIKEQIAKTDTIDIPAPTQSNGEYSVQVAAFQAEEVAGKVAEELVSKGYPAFVRTVDDPRKGRWHVIRIGKFKTREEALAYGNRVNKEETMIEEVIVVSENAGEKEKPISQRPKPDVLSDTVQKDTQVDEPDFEEEKSRVLEEIKRNKVLRDIEEKVREKEIGEEPKSEFNASDVGIEDTSLLSQVEQQTLKEKVIKFPDERIKAELKNPVQGRSIGPNVTAEDIVQAYKQDYLKNVEDTRLKVGITDRNILGPK